MSVRLELFNNLKVLLETMQGETFAGVRVEQVAAYDPISMAKEEYKNPIIVLTDRGTEELLVRDLEADRLATEFWIGIEVAEKTGDLMVTNVNELADAVRAMIIAQPDLGPNTLAVQWLGIDSLVFTEKSERAGMLTKIRPIYTQETGQEPQGAMIAPYGPQFLQDMQDELQARLAGLVQANGLASVHGRHRVANLRLPAATIQLESAIPGKISTNMVTVEWMAIGTIRIHIAYLGGPADQAKLLELTQGAINKVRSKLTPDSEGKYRITDTKILKVLEDFDDSKTIGAEIEVQIQDLGAHHDQE